MSSDDHSPPSSPLPNRDDDRLREANEHLTLKALRSLEQAEETQQRYLDQHQANTVLVQQQEQLRALASELILTERRERKRLAKELHDYLAQLLVFGRLKITTARAKTKLSDPDLVTVMSELDKILIDSLAYTRTLMAELSPPGLYELGLPSGLKWLGEHMMKHGLRVNVYLSHDEVLLPDDQIELLFHSVRELLLNVVKHAHTFQASLMLSVQGDQLRLIVQDLGSGFDAASLEANVSPREHFGLFSIRERMSAMGGSLQIDSGADLGTTITLKLPVTNPIISAQVSAARTTRPHLGVMPASNASAVRRILLVDDHAMVRQSLRTVLDRYSDITVIGEATDGAEAVSMAASLLPDGILMDIDMPTMGGIEATKLIKAAHPETVVIGLSVKNSTHMKEAMKRAGASAFVSKEAAVEELYDMLTASIPMPIGSQPGLPF